MPFSTVYLTVAEADTLAATTPGLLQWGAATASEKANALDAATKSIDGALRFQGRKCDAAQPLQFPRVAYDSAGGTQEVVWDWDDAASAAVIPPAVLSACLIEADEILQDLKGKSPRWRRLDEQHQGVTYGQTGGMSEAYRKGTPPAGRTGLSRRAYDLLARYRLASGRMT